MTTPERAVYPHRDHAEPGIDTVRQRPTPAEPHVTGSPAQHHVAIAYARMPLAPKRRFRRQRAMSLRLPRESLGPVTMQFVYTEGMPLFRGGHDAWVAAWLMAGAEVHVKLGMR